MRQAKRFRQVFIEAERARLVESDVLRDRVAAGEWTKDDNPLRGAPHTAAAYLERALGERAAGDPPAGLVHPRG